MENTCTQTLTCTIRIAFITPQNHMLSLHVVLPVVGKNSRTTRPKLSFFVAGNPCWAETIIIWIKKLNNIHHGALASQTPTQWY